MNEGQKLGSREAGVNVWNWVILRRCGSSAAGLAYCRYHVPPPLRDDLLGVLWHGGRVNKRDRNTTMLKRRHYRRLRRGRLASGRTIAVLAGAVLVGAVVGVGPTLLARHPAAVAGGAAVVSYSSPLNGCSVTDGDTIRCGDERIRLLGIDAPELPGHCRPGRDCAPGDPYASTASLQMAMVGTLTIEGVGEDHYGRTLAVVAGSKGDLSCWQLEHDQVIYKAKWDNGLRVARACPRTIL
jgi:hypothetical protein